MGVRHRGVVAAFLCATSAGAFACSSFNGNDPVKEQDAGTDASPSNTPPTTPPGTETPPSPTDAGVDGETGLADAGYYFENFEGDGPAAFWAKPVPVPVLGNVGIVPDKAYKGFKSLRAESLNGNGERSAYWTIEIPEPFAAIDIKLAVFVQTNLFATDWVHVVDEAKNTYSLGLSAPNATWSFSETDPVVLTPNAISFGMAKFDTWVPCSIRIEQAGNKILASCGGGTGQLTRTLKPFASMGGKTTLSFGIPSATEQGTLFLDDIAVQVLR